MSDSPEITKPQTATWKIMAGASVSIECLAKGNPSPQYVWTSNAASGTVTTDRYLILRDVNDSHGGIYTCTALNSLGSDSFVMLVKVTSKSCFALYVYVNYLASTESITTNPFTKNTIELKEMNISSVLNKKCCYEFWTLQLYIEEIVRSRRDSTVVLLT